MLYTAKDSFLRRTALALGVRANKPAWKPNISAFFEMVRPVETDKPLIRIGSDGDGGYLIPNDLDGIARCFSPGVSNVSEFENDLATRGVICHMADYSVNGPATPHALFEFRKKFLGVINDDVHIRLDDWVASTGSKDEDLILQMDIEGAEWAVLNTIHPALLARFRIAVIEMHFLDGIFDPFGLVVISNVFTLLKSVFEVVHIHPNNGEKPIVFKGLAVPPVMEFTLLRKDRIRRRAAITDFPHPLDRTNIPYKPDFPLPRCWYEPVSTR